MCYIHTIRSSSEILQNVHDDHPFARRSERACCHSRRARGYDLERADPGCDCRARGSTRKKRAFHETAEQRYGDVVSSGETIPLSEMRTYLEERIKGSKPPPGAKAVALSDRRNDTIESAPAVADDFDWILLHLAQYEVTDASARVSEIIQAISALETNPLVGRPTRNDTRELSHRPPVAGLCRSLSICARGRHRLCAGDKESAGGRLQVLIGSGSEPRTARAGSRRRGFRACLFRRLRLHLRLVPGRSGVAAFLDGTFLGRAGSIPIACSRMASSSPACTAIRCGLGHRSGQAATRHV